MMDARPTITDKTCVEDMTQEYPVTAVLLLRMGVQCVGCWVSRFHTVSDVAREWHLNLPDLLRELNALVEEERAHPQE
jgi:hybrid cluster-associated redox disulfide protein